MSANGSWRTSSATRMTTTCGPPGSGSRNRNSAPAYTMVTTAASAWMSSIPDRMPAMLQPEEMQEWLAGTGRLGFPALRREAGGHRARARGWVSGWWCAAGGVVPVRGFPCYYRIVVNVVFQFKQFSGTGYAHICGDGAAPHHHRESIVLGRSHTHRRAAITPAPVLAHADSVRPDGIGGTA